MSISTVATAINPSTDLPPEVVDAIDRMAGRNRGLKGTRAWRSYEISKREIRRLLGHRDRYAFDAAVARYLLGVRL